MTVTRIKRVVNPTRRPKAKKNGARKKLSDKQIKHFGTKAQRAALKRRRSAARAKNPGHAKLKRRGATSASAQFRYRDKKRDLSRDVPRRRKSNPAPVLLTIGALNPERKKRKGTKTVATKSLKRSKAAKKAAATRRRNMRAVQNPTRRRRATGHRNPRRARRNGTRVYVVKRNSRRNGARRNPEMFGMRGADAGKAILAGLVGVYATKAVTPMVSAAIPSIASSPIISALISAVVAWGGGMLVGKWDKKAGEGFMFGGLMQAGSSLLNLVVPANPLSLSGLGDFQAASFTVPQNPIMAAAQQRAIAAAQQAAPAKKSMSGMGAAANFR